MARTQIVTPDTGTLEVTAGERHITFTVRTGALQVTIKVGRNVQIDAFPVGSEEMTGEMTDSAIPTPAGYVLTMTDPRTPQQRMAH